MKRIFTLCVLAGLFVQMSQAARKQKTDFSFLQGERAVSCIIDWSELTIGGFSTDEWIEKRQAEQPQYDATHEFNDQLLPQVGLLIEHANKQLEKAHLFLSNKEGKKYTLYVIPQNISQKGDNTVRFEMKETATGKVMAQFEIEGDGGVFGSMSNLWGDGFKDAGKKLGKLMLKSLNKSSEDASF